MVRYLYWPGGQWIEIGRCFSWFTKRFWGSLLKMAWAVVPADLGK